ncbi:glutathione peroxidase [Stappia indica]|uniref:Glutathione peroxidase n=1 Tax=Stappia indica TaxID=538381 RepID=A0A857C510_9HYPH|nr:glutathione peroxidase [Stappia indica]QGZ34007.1 redoxin domain-containing protein [Stappia indica]
MNRLFARLACALLTLAALGGPPLRADERTAHDFSLTAIDGSAMPLSAYRGKTVLVVNTASRCSFTQQYAPLQALHEEYRDRGLVVIGVPSNDFGGQEPGTEGDIEDFTRSAYRVDFPLTNKTSVRGEAATPFYKWVTREAGPLGAPRWNFQKYLIGPDGRLVEWYTPMTEPDSPRLRAAIERSLATHASTAGGS